MNQSIWCCIFLAKIARVYNLLIDYNNSLMTYRYFIKYIKFTQKMFYDVWNYA